MRFTTAFLSFILAILFTGSIPSVVLSQEMPVGVARSAGAKTRYTNITRFGLIRWSSINTFSAGMINGFAKPSSAQGGNLSVGLGLGLGFEKYHDAKGVPIYIDCRLIFEEERVSPLFYFDAGYSLINLNIDNSWNRGGILFGGGGGLKILSANNKISFLLEAGYKKQMATGLDYRQNAYWDGHSYEFISYPVDKSTSWNFFTLSVGFVF